MKYLILTLCIFQFIFSTTYAEELNPQILNYTRSKSLDYCTKVSGKSEEDCLKEYTVHETQLKYHADCNSTCFNKNEDDRIKCLSADLSDEPIDQYRSFKNIKNALLDNCDNIDHPTEKNACYYRMAILIMLNIDNCSSLLIDEKKNLVSKCEQYKNGILEFQNLPEKYNKADLGLIAEDFKKYLDEYLAVPQ